MASDKLLLHERIAAGLISGSFLLLTLYIFLFSPLIPSSESSLPLSHLEITILGAVMHPGEYQLAMGSTLNDLLELAQPTREADLNRMRKQRKLTHGEEIHIPIKKPLNIYVNGQKAQVPRGARVCDLRLWIDLDTNIADQLTSKRRLKEGDQLVFP